MCCDFRKFRFVRKIMLLINFIFDLTFFLIASSQIFKNDAILINHGSFYQEKDSLQIDRFQCLKMNSLMAEIIKKTIFQNKIFINKLLYFIIINSISKIENGQVVENLFAKKMNRDLLKSHHF